MTKQITITFSDFAYEMYVETYTGINKSKYIEKLFLIGAETYLGDTENYKKRLFKIIRRNNTLIEENNKLKAKLGRQKRILNKDKIKQKKDEEQYYKRKRVLDSVNATGIREVIE